MQCPKCVNMAENGRLGGYFFLFKIRFYKFYVLNIESLVEGFPAKFC